MSRNQGKNTINKSQEKKSSPEASNPTTDRILDVTA